MRNIKIDHESEICQIRILSADLVDSKKNYNHNLNIYRRNIYIKLELGSWLESEVAGFFVYSHIRMIVYFRLGSKRNPKGWNISSVGLKLPAGLKIRGKLLWFLGTRNFGFTHDLSLKAYPPPRRSPMHVIKLTLSYFAYNCSQLTMALLDSLAAPLSTRA